MSQFAGGVSWIEHLFQLIVISTDGEFMTLQIGDW